MEDTVGEAPSVANLMKLMIEDRKKREEEIAAERESDESVRWTQGYRRWPGKWR